MIRKTRATIAEVRSAAAWGGPRVCPSAGRGRSAKGERGWCPRGGGARREGASGRTPQSEDRTELGERKGGKEGKRLVVGGKGGGGPGGRGQAAAVVGAWEGRRGKGPPDPKFFSGTPADLLGRRLLQVPLSSHQLWAALHCLLVLALVARRSSLTLCRLFLFSPCDLQEATIP